MALTKLQQKAAATAARLRALSGRCKAFAEFVGYQSVKHRLDALAAEYQEEASAIEKGAGLRIGRRRSSRVLGLIDCKYPGAN